MALGGVISHQSSKCNNESGLANSDDCIRAWGLEDGLLLLLLFGAGRAPLKSHEALAFQNYKSLLFDLQTYEILDSKASFELRIGSFEASRCDLACWGCFEAVFFSCFWDLKTGKKLKQSTKRRWRPPKRGPRSGFTPKQVYFWGLCCMAWAHGSASPRAP